MGGSALAARGDGAAMFLNPAGVAGLPAPEAYFMYQRFYAGLSGVDAIGQSFVAFAAPTRAGALAAGLAQFQASGLLQERVVGLSFARRWFGAFDAGVTAKHMHRRFLVESDSAAAADPVFRGGAGRSVFALDLGGAVAATESLTAGLAARNLNRPDAGLATPDPVARELQASLAWRSRSRGLRATADYAYRELDSGTPRDRSVPGVGLEKSLQGGRAAFRVGATPDRFGGGAGIRFGRLSFDYAFVLNRELLADSAGNHMIGVRYRFGAAGEAAP